MIERYMPLADKIARRYSHTSEPLDDLVQVARLGLIKAVDRWDPDRGTAFSTFAVPTITGELRRYFRDGTWTVRPPRDLQDLYLAVRRVRESLMNELGREHERVGCSQMHVSRILIDSLARMRAAATETNLDFG